MVVLGLVGPLQSGKTSVAEILRAKYNFTVIYLPSTSPYSLSRQFSRASSRAASPLSLTLSVSPPALPCGIDGNERDERAGGDAHAGVHFHPLNQKGHRASAAPAATHSGKRGDEATRNPETTKRAVKASRLQRCTGDPSQVSEEGLPCSTEGDAASSFFKCQGLSSKARTSLSPAEDAPAADGEAYTPGVRTPLEQRQEPHNDAAVVNSCSRMWFADATAVVDFVTGRWRQHFVILGISSLEEVRTLRKRPFFALVAVDAPFGVRVARMKAKEGAQFSLESMLEREDQLCFRSEAPLRDCAASPQVDGVRACMAVADVHLTADGDSDLLERKIAAAGFLSEELVRPSWDTYFMRLTYLAATRSNCMKRRVGAIVARGNRVIATGYNGTPSQASNCNEGGCARCNDPRVSQGRELEACECIHAEANALLEAGRDRAMNSTLYVTCLPCLGCAKLVVQSAIRTVVYAEEYDHRSGALSLLTRMGVTVRQFSEDHPGVPGMTIAVKTC
ncbi:cytidine and deoxycytidylate deaminase zinc-binding region domain-containing protein [Besnoitia besnoiti]|uniref:dCMP deaminase n=1 Tax=Besnoitia besnoiti TaxID=94643 RepID=A0A2A9MFI3_BESBE|nr:cytidine and deoxycytidylate deaminase zinc-binding region domain-containing protein [Besnoitia besnoiti]PFH34413.1 cytidine and deoxycytidylate deaminase zinc-binding region domain-containing protein [Besnoitia besnoiti]